MKLKHFLLAWQLLTVIPLKKVFPDKKEDLAASFVFFPIVGMGIGIFLSLINLAGSAFLPFSVTNALVVIGWVWITGALHLDGLADTIDGISAKGDKKNILRVMGDGLIGAKGVVGLICILLLKFVLLRGINPEIKNQVLIYIPVVSRWSMVLGAYLASYAKEEGMGKAYIELVDLKEVIWASLITASLGLALLRLSFLPFIGIALLSIFLWVAYLKRKIVGITGDSLGAMNETVETLGLFSFCLW